MRMSELIWDLGDVVNYTNGSEADIASGDVVAMASCCGVATCNISIGETGTVKLNGVWKLPAVSSASFAVGDVVYWSTSEHNVTKTASSNVPCGVVVEAKASSTKEALVKIGLIIAQPGA